MEVWVCGDVGVNGGLATGTADRTITIPLNRGENMIRECYQHQGLPNNKNDSSGPLRCRV